MSHLARALDAINAATAEPGFTERKEHVERACCALTDAQQNSEDVQAIEDALRRIAPAALALAKVTADVAFDEREPESVRRGCYREARRAWALGLQCLSPKLRRHPLPLRVLAVELKFPWAYSVALAGMRPRS